MILSRHFKKNQREEEVIRLLPAPSQRSVVPSGRAARQLAVGKPVGPLMC